MPCDLKDTGYYKRLKIQHRKAPVMFQARCAHGYRVRIAEVKDTTRCSAGINSHDFLTSFTEISQCTLKDKHRHHASLYTLHFLPKLVYNKTILRTSMQHATT